MATGAERMTQPDGRTIEACTSDMTPVLAAFMAANQATPGFTFFEGKNADDLAGNVLVAIWLWMEGREAIAYGHIESSASARKSGVVRLGVCVDSEHQGQGLGSDVVAFLIAQARAQGQRKIVATVYADNAAALRIYAKHGFREEGRYIAEEYVDGCYRDVVSLAKFL